MWQQLAEGFGQAVVQDDDGVLGMVGDIDDLLGKEPDVQRMQDRAHRGHRQVGHEVLGVVPHEGGDALVAVDAQAPQGVGELSSLGAHLGERCPPRLLPGPGHHLLVGIQLGAGPEDS